MSAIWIIFFELYLFEQKRHIKNKAHKKQNKIFPSKSKTLKPFEETHTENRQ